MTEQIFINIIGQLRQLLGPVIADIVARIILREAKLDFNPEQLKQLAENRAKAQKALVDEEKRAKGEKP